MNLHRPLLRWHGGKWLLAPWIISHFPPHRRYIEPFGGAASVLLRKPRCYSEVYNDLDGEVVNLFRMLRSDRAGELVRQVALTPFARDEFKEAYLIAEDPVERARRLIIRCFMGFGSNAHGRLTGFRDMSSKSGTTPARDWRNYPDTLAAIIDRLSGVVIENRDAKIVMERNDAPDALHYLDPPYVSGTRDGGSDYAHEMSDEQHIELLAFVQSLKGTVIISGYHSEIYDAGLSGWSRHERPHLADGARSRTEVLWINRQSERLL